MCALSKIRLSFKFETFLHMIARSLDKPLQMTALVNFAFSPKTLVKRSVSKGITRCQANKYSFVYPFVGIQNDNDRPRVIMSRATD
jgi:hypothetical protein